jgi:phage terminase large subunit-like protein
MQATLEARRLQAKSSKNLVPLSETPLAEFIPRVTPRWMPPRHLAPILDVYERIKRGERVQVLLSVPPQHAKTETGLHFLAQLLLLRPHLRNAYVTYGANFSLTRNRLARGYTKAAGVRLRSDATAVHDWWTADGGGVLATSISGELTGRPIDGVLFIDDPHKGRAEAESALERQKVKDFLTSTAFPRVHPTASVVVCHTRWHEDDTIGWLRRECEEHGFECPSFPVCKPAWEYINLPAINDAGEALWPALRPLDFLERIRRRNEYDWWSLYMGAPRPKGGSLFGDVVLYTERPKSFRVSIGVDLAYSEKTHAGFSVAVVLLECDGIYYVANVVRKQCLAPAFAQELVKLKTAWPSAKWRWYGYGTEKGSADFLSTLGVNVGYKQGSGDKFQRAQPVAAAWNRGEIRLPDRAVFGEKDWLDPFVSEIKDFSGIKDLHDDQVDALAAAYDVLARGSRAKSGVIVGQSIDNASTALIYDPIAAVVGSAAAPRAATAMNAEQTELARWGAGGAAATSPTAIPKPIDVDQAALIRWARGE